MNKSDTYGIVILCVLYFYQGLILGLPGGGLQIILTDKKMPYNKIGMFSFCVIPFAFKFLWSPILDYYFVERFGKRKTYIVPTTILIAILFFYLAMNINQIILEEDINKLFWCFILIIFFLATSDTAVDGWALTLLSEANIGLQSVCQQLGQSIGWFISQYIFILLNSVDFSNKYLNVTVSEEPFVSLAQYFYFICFLGLSLTVWVIFGTSETNPPEIHKFASFVDELKTIKGLYYNKYLRTLCIIFFVKRIGFGAMEAAGAVYLVGHGFPKETLSRVAILIFPVMIAILFCVGKYITGRRRENKIMMICLGYGIVNMIVYTFAIFDFSRDKETGSVLIILLNLFIYEILKKIIYTVSFAFLTQISEAQLGAIQISTIGSISNISRVIIDPLFVALLSYIPYVLLLILAIAEQIWVLKKYGRKYVQMQYLQKDVWSLQNEHYIELQG